MKDCGRKGQVKDLSFTKALEETNLAHPRVMNADGTYSRHKYCRTHTGAHILLCKNTKSDLEKYGIGVVLYFKFLKVSMFVFC